MIFSSCVFIFPPVSSFFPSYAKQLIVLLSQVVYWGKIFFPPVSMFFPLAMLYGIYFTFLPRQLFGYELEEKQYNIFPPGPVFFLLVTQKNLQYGTFTKCLSLSCHSRLHSSQYSIENTPLFLGKTNNLMVYNAH
jgi:hypothetical protein